MFLTQIACVCRRRKGRSKPTASAQPRSKRPAAAKNAAAATVQPAAGVSRGDHYVKRSRPHSQKASTSSKASESKRPEKQQKQAVGTTTAVVPQAGASPDADRDHASTESESSLRTRVHSLEQRVASLEAAPQADRNPALTASVDTQTEPKPAGQNHESCI